MSHMSEQWTDRFGREHNSCSECEEPWPCWESTVKPPGWLVPGYVDATAIVEAAAHGFGVTVSEILGDGRSRNLNPPRICAMAAVRQRTGWSWAQMGRFFNRDHTTVMHHVAHVTASSALSASVDALLTDLQPIPRLFAVPDVG